MKDFTRFVDLASERVGGCVLAANDEFFAPKENLLKASKPVFLEDKYTDRGKWMDGWETRRRRTEGHDWCVIRLGLAGEIHGVVVDTSHFRGNFPEACSIEACTAAPDATADTLASAATTWTELLPKTKLEGDTLNKFAVHDPNRYTHLRFHIHPDGGVARLRVHGMVRPDWLRLRAAGAEMDLAAVENGGRVLASSDEFFGSPLNLLMPGRGAHMGDGWETRRRRGPGFDWVVIQLGTAGTIHRIEVDTAHFKGNFPESCSLESACWEDEGTETLPPALDWKVVLAQTKLGADRAHEFVNESIASGRATHVRFSIYPDGGVSRLRIYGTPLGDATIARPAANGLARFNALPAAAAAAALVDCCGSSRWARQMVAARPFGSVGALYAAASRIWASLGPADWREAFVSHPAIGEKKAAAGQSALAGRWSAEEQSAGADDAETLKSLAEYNRAYRERFGYLFIVCAARKTKKEMLEILRDRLKNHPDTELPIAAAEQEKIMRLRLERLLDA